jgi:hypothetical protein
MKSQVIQLDLHDDVVSVRDKMSWAKTPRVLLVFPRRYRILNRQLDLRLIQRYAERLGVQLALVTRSTVVREMAEDLKIPVFRNTGQAQRSAWHAREITRPPLRHSPRPVLQRMRQEASPLESRWRNQPLARLVPFSLAVLSVLALLLLFVPSATIALKPAGRIQSESLSIRASPSVEAVSLAGSIPAQTALLVVQGTKSIQATGSMVVPDQPAQGEVRFSNLTTSLLGIPSGTIVRTQGDPAIRFATRSDGVLAGGVGNSLDIPVQAVVAGSAGNLPADQLVAIEGDLGASLAVSNPAPTTGGSDQVAPVATADDRLRLHNALLEDLRQAAIGQFGQMHDPGDILIPDTISVVQVLSETYFPADGQPGADVTLDLQVRLQMLYVKGSDLQALALAVLDSTLPADQVQIPGSLSIRPLGAPTTGADGFSRGQIQVQQTVRSQVNPLIVGQLVQGRRIQDASRILSDAYSLATHPTIRVAPSWWPVLPWLPFRIVTVLQ